MGIAVSEINKSDRITNLLNPLILAEFKNATNLVNITKKKKKQTSNIEKKLVVGCQWI